MKTPRLVLAVILAMAVGVAVAMVQVNKVVVLDNPSPFFNPFKFNITFVCTDDLPDGLEWKIIYVGSAETEEHDQVLDSVLVGPVPAGRHMFVFQADPPDTSKIPPQDAIGVTVVLLTCSYHGLEFIRVGYYVNNEYSDPELRENPPSVPQFDKLQRNILTNQPRVTRFHIDWDNSEDQEKKPLQDTQQPQEVTTTGFGPPPVLSDAGGQH